MNLAKYIEFPYLRIRKGFYLCGNNILLPHIYTKNISCDLSLN